MSCGAGGREAVDSRTMLGNTAGVYKYIVEGDSNIPPGTHTLTLDFDFKGEKAGGPADVTIKVDGNAVGTGHIEHSIPIRVSLDETLDVGEWRGNGRVRGICEGK